MASTATGLGALISQPTDTPSDQGLCHIGKLPPEIFANIIIYLKVEGFRYALPSLNVSRHWKELVTPIIYQSLHLHSSDIVPFVQRIRNGYELIRNLTITWQNDFPNRCDCPEAEPPRTNYVGNRPICNAKHVHKICARAQVPEANVHTRPEYLQPGKKDLIQLCDILKNALPQVTTLSLTVDNEPDAGPWCACIVSAFPSNLMAHVLSSLPPTCVNLELDTRGADRHPDYAQEALYPSHVCGQIGALLPRLHSLRLRLGGLCQDFFLPPQSWGQSPLPGSARQYWNIEHLDDDYSDSGQCENLTSLELAWLTRDQYQHRDWLKLDSLSKEVLPFTKMSQVFDANICSTGKNNTARSFPRIQVLLSELTHICIP